MKHQSFSTIAIAIFVYLMMIVTCHTLNFPSDFQRCSLSQSDFNECIGQATVKALNTVSKGRKELGIPSLDPLYVSSITIKGNGGSVDLNQEYKDCNIYGLFQAKFVKGDFNFSKDNCFLNFDTFNEVLTMTANYKFTGKLLLFQLNGHGRANLTSVHMRAHHSINCEFYEKDGEEYVRPIDLTESFEIDQMLMDFDNLIDGNPELSANVLQVMNDNNMEVFMSLKQDYQRSYAAVYLQIAKNVFSKIPFKELFLD